MNDHAETPDWPDPQHAVPQPRGDAHPVPGVPDRGPVPRPPQLTAQALHLWRIRTDARGGDLAACRACLGERERARADAMSHAPYRERWVRAQAGLRRVLAAYLGLAPREVGFVRGPVGKPYLAGERPAIQFNLTTTGDLALVGVLRDLEIGVDCERLRPRPNWGAIARRMLDPQRAAAIAAAPEHRQLALFYRAWTALEADAKADGRGLFRPRAPGSAAPEIGHCVPAPGYVAAVAAARLPPRASWVFLDLPPA